MKYNLECNCYLEIQIEMNLILIGIWLVGVAILLSVVRFETQFSVKDAVNYYVAANVVRKLLMLRLNR